MVSTNKIIGAVVGVVIGLILIGTMLPIGINSLYNASWDASVDAGLLTMIQVVLPILAVIGLLLVFVPLGKKYLR
ncbi:MAG: hypothetical protein GF317_01700 [Candidatus Lokiarchaeota archaeon]|nr:hypothetical protein [Candidatus Lokiarchaeota archaeon]